MNWMWDRGSNTDRWMFISISFGCVPTGRGGTVRSISSTNSSCGRPDGKRRLRRSQERSFAKAVAPTRNRPRRLAQQGAAPAPPGSPRRGGTFPTGSDPVQSRGTGAPQPVCQGNPSGCVLGGWGGGGEKKKRWVRLESQRPPPPPDGPRPFPLCELQRRGGGETEEPASRHGLGVTEFPGRPGGCGRQGRTTPAGAAAQRPARATVTGAETTGPGRLGSASRKRGPWVPLCEGRRRGAGQPPAAGSLDACPPAGAPVGPAAFPPRQLPFGGRVSPPPALLRAAQGSPFPHAPCLGFSSYRKGITIPSPPTPTLRSFPSPSFNFLFFPRRALGSSALSSRVRRFPPTFRLSEQRRSERGVIFPSLW
ncbi:collagen alpha-1(III) chain-like [Dama dama]|uniref:collagen alpha-1(III) chain-like n=1 Tax=Dama dama TaxID=30532 RepID=UPI002A36D08A|nr:collagen alpha-1(III) chain-like [Dama dama]